MIIPSEAAVKDGSGMPARNWFTPIPMGELAP